MSNDILKDQLFKKFQSCIQSFREYERIEELNNEIKMFKKDPLFSSLGLDNKRFIEARIRGGFVMSVTRKLGDLFQGCIKEIVKSQLDLSDKQISYKTKIYGKTRKLDAIIRLSDLSIPNKHRIEKIIKQEEREMLTIKHDAIGLEVRYSYQIGNSKRIQADEDMAKHLNRNGILPVMPVFSKIYLKDPIKRLRQSWKVKVGEESFSFLKSLTNFDFLKFLSENENKFRRETFQVLENVEKRIK